MTMDFDEEATPPESYRGSEAGPGFHSEEIKPTCPLCGGTQLQSRDLALRLCAALGALAGALGGAANAMAGAEIGAELGAIGGGTAAGPPGAALGLISGAVLGALVAAAAGCAAGVELGSAIDRLVLHNVRCLNCGHAFSVTADQH